MKKRKYIQNISIFLIAIICSSFLILQRVNELSLLIPMSDELEVINSTIAVAETGIPQLKPPNNHAAYNPNYPSEGYTKVTSRYAIEYYLRAFIYKITTAFGLDWKYASNFFYFLLFPIAFLIFYLYFKKTFIPISSVGFLLILIGASTWASSSFHYVRYYAFTLIFVLVCHIAAFYCYFVWKQPIWKKILLTLLIAWIPGGLIHEANYVIAAFWVVVITVFETRRIFFLKNIAEKAKKRGLFTLSIIFFSGILLILLPGRIPIIDVKNPVRAFLGRFNKVDFSSEAFMAFADLNFNTSFLGITMTLSLVCFAIWKLSLLNKYGAYLWKLCLTSTIFSFFLLFFLLDNNYIGYFGYNRYFFVVHVQYLLFLSLCLTVLYRYIVKNIKIVVQIKRVLVFVALITPFVVSLSPLSSLPPKTYDFSIGPRIKQHYKKKIQQLASNPNTLMITNHPYFAFTLIDNNPIFVLSKYPDTLRQVPPNSTVMLGEKKMNAKGQIIYQKHKDNTVIGSLGLPLISNEQEFCETMTKFSKWNVILHIHQYHNNSDIGGSLQKKMNELDYLGNQAILKPANTFYQEFCIGSNDTSTNKKNEQNE